MKVNQYISSIDIKSGGTTRLVLDLNNYLKEYENINSKIVISIKDLYLKSTDGNISHIHGLWNLINILAFIKCYLTNASYVIHTHGMLDPWALNSKKTKKKLVLSLFLRKIILKANVIIATSNIEYKNIRNLGFENVPIAIIPNGISIHPSANDNIKPFGEKKNILFLGRIHPVKGLLELIEACKILKSSTNNNWIIKIVGPIEDFKYYSKLQLKIKEYSLENLILFYPMADEKTKKLFYEETDFFVLPSHSENFGIVVAEALSYGIPVITTKNTPWSDLEKYKCGWSVELNSKNLVDTLQVAINIDDSSLREMRQNAKNYAIQFSWKTISCNMAKVYKWVLNKSSRPDFILID